MTAVRDLVGKQYGRLLVLARQRDAAPPVMWHCRCSCGGLLVVRGSALTSGNSKSCGCLVRESMARVGRANRTHGLSHTVEYNSWRAMLGRCYDPDNNKYHLYGKRGIRVCDRWRDSFENFLADMGRRPEPGLSLDRFPDTSGNYEPMNCRWATASQQNKNRRPFKRRRRS